MRSTSLLVLLALSGLGLVAASCSKDEAKPGAVDAGASTSSRLASCDRVPTASVCSEYRIDGNEASVTAGCTKLAGTFVFAECPNTSVLGQCAMSTGESRKFYGGGGTPFDAARAQRECETSYKGKWSVYAAK